MAIFRRGERLGIGRAEATGAVRVESAGFPRSARRYRIRITTVDGEVLYWHKRGEVHVVDEDVARVFVASFKPELFQVLPDGSLTSPAPGRTKPIRAVEMEPV
jgi:hypothetical protein